MATQIKFTNSPSNDYVVIDNGTAGASTTGSFPGSLSVGSQLGNWIGIQADGSAQGFDTTTGATAQGSNTFKNGTIPDYIATGATTVLNSPLSTRLLYKNPVLIPNLCKEFYEYTLSTPDLCRCFPKSVSTDCTNKCRLQPR